MLFKQSFQALCSHYNQQPERLAPRDDGEQTWGKESSNVARVVSHELFLRFGTWCKYTACCTAERNTCKYKILNQPIILLVLQYQANIDFDPST